MSITDPVEMVVASALDRAGVAFVHESTNKHLTNGLDFFLPGRATYIECSRFHTPRKIEQMGRVGSCILIQGMDAALTFSALLAGECRK